MQPRQAILTCTKKSQAFLDINQTKNIFLQLGKEIML